MSKLGIECDLWNLIQAIDQRKAPARPAAAINSPKDQARPTVTDKEKADLFYQAFEIVSRIPKNKEEDKPVRRLARNATKQEWGCGESAQCSTFNSHELEFALDEIKTGKSPGLDGVSNDLLVELSSKAKEAVLHFINMSWTKKETASSWRKAEILAIPKKGKDASKVGSYRSISLLSSISKLLSGCSRGD